MQFIPCGDINVPLAAADGAEALALNDLVFINFMTR